MAVRKLCIPTVLAYFIILLSLSPHHVLADGGSKFSLGGAPGTATAIVTEPKLNLGVNFGPSTGYPTNYQTAKKFTLTVGGCVLELSPYRVEPDVQVGVIANGKDQQNVLGLKSIVTADAGNIILIGNSPQNISECIVSFGDKQPDGFHIKVELAGDVPKTFILTSDALMEGPKVDSAKLPLWAIIGLSVGAVILLVILAVVVGFIAYRRRKKRALKQMQKVQDMQLKTAKSLEAVPTNAADVKDVKIAESVSKAGEPKKKPDVKKERSKESSGNKAKSKEAGAKELDGKKLKGTKAQANESDGKKSDKEKPDGAKMKAKARDNKKPDKGESESIRAKAKERNGKKLDEDNSESIRAKERDDKKPDEDRPKREKTKTNDGAERDSNDEIEARMAMAKLGPDYRKLYKLKQKMMKSKLSQKSDKEMPADYTLPEKRKEKKPARRPMGSNSTDEETPS